MRSVSNVGPASHVQSIAAAVFRVHLHTKSVMLTLQAASCSISWSSTVHRTVVATETTGETFSSTLRPREAKSLTRNPNP